MTIMSNMETIDLVKLGWRVLETAESPTGLWWVPPFTDSIMFSTWGAAHTWYKNQGQYPSEIETYD